VNNGKQRAFIIHMEKGSNSAHNCSVKCYDNLKTGFAKLHVLYIRYQ
jgi:hypothetical protein